MDSEANRKWNLRTLLLLARAECLELDWSAPQACGPGDAERAAPDEVVIRLLRTYDAEEWWSQAEKVRARILEPVEIMGRQLNRLLAQEECVADLLDDCYRSLDPDVPVVLACGGCPFCRADGIDPFAGGLRCRHTPEQPWPARGVGEALRQFLAGQKTGLIFYRRQCDEEQLPLIVRWLLEQRVLCLTACDEEVERLGNWFRAHPAAVFRDRFPPPGVLERQAAVVVIRPAIQAGSSAGGTSSLADGPNLKEVWPRLSERDGITIVILPEDSRQPDHPARLLRDMWTGPKLDVELWKDRYEE